MKSVLLTGVLCSVIGLAVGAVLSGSAPATTSFQVDHHTVRREIGGNGLDRAEMAAIVRQELARERGHAPAVTQVTAPAPVETADEARARMSEDELEHAERATQTLRSAVSRGQWTVEDRSALVVQIAKLPAAVQAEIGGQLAVALNKGDLKMEGDWLPL